MTVAVPEGTGSRHVRRQDLIVPGSRDAADVIYGDLRARILAGDVPAGSELSQTGVAREYRVSRGPVREAFRLLQRDGMIAASVNRRARVAGLSVAEVEHLYALRVANEPMAFGLSVPRLTAEDLDELDRLVGSEAAVRLSEPDGFARWEHGHHRFHMGLVRHTGDRMAGSIEQWVEHTGRYRRIYVDDGWSLGNPEHARIAALARARDVPAATTMLARHLAWAGLALIATIDPAHEPVLLRAAIRQVLPASDGPSS